MAARGRCTVAQLQWQPAPHPAAPTGKNFQPRKKRLQTELAALFSSRKLMFFYYFINSSLCIP
jgi:hypothetical protein